uniref:Evasin n=1 Tax=Amblyomma parvum TaxID=251391 RepID=A0A023G109_AMBPA
MTSGMPFTVVLFLCAFQVLFGFSENTGHELSDEDCDDNSTCIIQSLNTTGDPLTVGCMCENSTEYLPNGTECLGLSEAAATRMQVNVSYVCPVGLCYNGFCERSGLSIQCWHDTQPPNSTNVTTKAPTIAARSEM